MFQDNKMHYVFISDGDGDVMVLFTIGAMTTFPFKVIFNEWIFLILSCFNLISSSLEVKEFASVHHEKNFCSSLLFHGHISVASSALIDVNIFEVKYLPLLIFHRERQKFTLFQIEIVFLSCMSEIHKSINSVHHRKFLVQFSQGTNIKNLNSIP